jgi:hypothetical protein
MESMVFFHGSKPMELSQHTKNNSGPPRHIPDPPSFQNRIGEEKIEDSRDEGVEWGAIDYSITPYKINMLILS